jgi:hypothetical protein
VLEQQQQNPIFKTITDALGDELNWRWEERLDALLSEFSWEKKEKVLLTIQSMFDHEWNKKNIKKAPAVIKTELGELAKLTKAQLLFTQPATEQTPAIALIWWPWGHGATYSIRIKILHSDYDAADLTLASSSFFEKFVARFTAL